MKAVWRFFVRVCMWLRNIFTGKVIQSRTQRYSGGTTEDKISEQAAYLCQKYIEARFTRSNLCYYNPKRHRKKASAVECSDDVVRTLNEVGALLEKGYPNLYSNVLDQLNFRISFGIIVCNMFNRVSEQIISNGISWPRIVAVYAFAGALAYDFTQVGDTRFIQCLSTWMGQFSAKRLSPWIRLNGGWEGIVNHFKEEKYPLVTCISRWLTANSSREYENGGELIMNET